MRRQTPHINQHRISTSAQLGISYEREAIRYLRDNGYHILERNYRFRHYEIDLIALSVQSTLVFIEVKYRHAHPHIPITAAISERQQKHIIRASEQFLTLHPNLKDYYAQYDAILFTTTPAKATSAHNRASSNCTLMHIEHAFSYTSAT